MRPLYVLVLAMAAALSGCAQYGNYQPTDNMGSNRSGVTVYGEIDTSITRTR